MLILTRRIGESFYIGDDVIVTVTRVKGNQVFIGFTAPKDVRIDREEIRERILKETGEVDGNRLDSFEDEPVTSR